MATNIVSIFGTDMWLSDLNKLCFEYLNYIKTLPGGQYLYFNVDLLGTAEKKGKIVKEYHKSVEKFKRKTYGANARYSYIDHHKIAAFYIRAFLKFSPFEYIPPKQSKKLKQCPYTKLPNEFFLIRLLEAIFKAANNKFNYSLVMPLGYMNNLIRIFYAYKNNIDKYEPAAMSNIIFFIEQQYFKED